MKEYDVIENFLASAYAHIVLNFKINTLLYHSLIDFYK